MAKSEKNLGFIVGMNAYERWIENDNIGKTEDEFIEYLVGAADINEYGFKLMWEGNGSSVYFSDDEAEAVYLVQFMPTLRNSGGGSSDEWKFNGGKDPETGHQLIQSYARNLGYTEWFLTDEGQYYIGDPKSLLFPQYSYDFSIYAIIGTNHHFLQPKKSSLLNVSPNAYNFWYNPISNRNKYFRTYVTGEIKGILPMTEKMLESYNGSIKLTQGSGIFYSLKLSKNAVEYYGDFDTRMHLYLSEDGVNSEESLQGLVSISRVFKMIKLNKGKYGDQVYENI